MDTETEDLLKRELLTRVVGLEEDLQKAFELLGEAMRTLRAIERMAEAEMQRIERHGGTSGFASRVYELARKGQ